MSAHLKKRLYGLTLLRKDFHLGWGHAGECCDPGLVLQVPSGGACGGYMSWGSRCNSVDQAIGIHNIDNLCGLWQALPGVCRGYNGCWGSQQHLQVHKLGRGPEYAAVVAQAGLYAHARLCGPVAGA